MQQWKLFFWLNQRSGINERQQYFSFICHKSIEISHISAFESAVIEIIIIEIVLEANTWMQKIKNTQTTQNKDTNKLG